MGCIVLLYRHGLEGDSQVEAILWARLYIYMHNVKRVHWCLRFCFYREDILILRKD
ncbi:unnamed protein product [Brassica rapa subsp. trilocularis]